MDNPPDQGDSWWFANHSEMILGWFVNHSKMNLEWFLVIHEPLWNDSGAILSDSWTTLKCFWGNSWWFMNHSEMILVLFANHSEMIPGWFLMICKPLKWFWDDSRCFACIPLWNDFGVVLGDSWTTLKWFWGNSRQISVICKSF